MVHLIVANNRHIVKAVTNMDKVTWSLILEK